MDVALTVHSLYCIILLVLVLGGGLVNSGVWFGCGEVQVQASINRRAGLGDFFYACMAFWELPCLLLLGLGGET